MCIIENFWLYFTTLQKLIKTITPVQATKKKIHQYFPPENPSKSTFQHIPKKSNTYRSLTAKKHSINRHRGPQHHDRKTRKPYTRRICAKSIWYARLSSHVCPGRLHVLIFLDDRAVCDNLTASAHNSRLVFPTAFWWNEERKWRMAPTTTHARNTPTPGWLMVSTPMGCSGKMTDLDGFYIYFFFWIFVCDSRFVRAICSSMDCDDSRSSRSYLFELKVIFWKFRSVFN